MKKRNNDTWENLYPLTLDSNVSNKYGETLDKVNGLTTDHIAVYVDVANGEDKPGNGDITNPYKTLQYAVDQIPKLINYDRFIYVADGVYNEDVRVKSINGGAIVIGRKDGIVDPFTSSTGFLVKSIEFLDCTGRCRVNNAEQYDTENTTAEAFIRFSRCGYGTAHRIRCANAGVTVDSVQFDGTTGSVNSSYFDGQNYCIVSKNGSSVRVDSTNQHGNNESGTGILAQAGQVYFNGDVKWIEKTKNWVAQSQGGQVHYTIKQLDLEPLLQNNWGVYSDASTQHPRAIKHNGVVYLQGLIADGDVGQGITAFQLPPLWRPQFNNRFYAPFCSDGNISKVQIDVTGTCVVEVATGRYISLSDIPPFYVGE